MAGSGLITISEDNESFYWGRTVILNTIETHFH